MVLSILKYGDCQLSTAGRLTWIPVPLWRTLEAARRNMTLPRVALPVQSDKQVCRQSPGSGVGGYWRDELGYEELLLIELGESGD